MAEEGVDAARAVFKEAYANGNALARARIE